MDFLPLAVGWFAALFSPANWRYEAIFRLLFASVCGAIVGIEREYHGRAAGLRTHLLVSLGSTLVMVVALDPSYLGGPGARGSAAVLRVDPGRLAQAIMTGIGFLGAGTIIRHGANIRGLTTAASLWCVAALGVSIGYGLYLISLVAVVVILLALTVVDRMEKSMQPQRYKTVVVTCTDRPEKIDQLVAAFERREIKVIDVQYIKNIPKGSLEATFHIRFSGSSYTYHIDRQFEDDPDIKTFKFL